MLRSLARVLALPDPEIRLVWALALAIALGVTAVVPILPLYARELGADVRFVGYMMAAFMAARLPMQALAGAASDRFGRRALMGVGLGLYAAASLAFPLVTDKSWLLALRAVEGAAAACFMPAALAYVADRMPEARRARAVSALAVAENVGLLLGPVFGGVLAAALGLKAPFFVLGAVCFLGTWGVWRLQAPVASRPLRGSGSLAAPDPSHRAGTGPLRLPPAKAPALPRWRPRPVLPARLEAAIASRALTSGFAMGLYETVWPIYMLDRGATAWEISLSWTLFAVPPIALAGASARAVERWGPLLPAALGGAFSALIIVSYDLAPAPWTILTLSTVEALGFAFAYPAYNALLIRLAPEASRGRVIGRSGAFWTAGALLGAFACPWLYQIDPTACFVVTGGAVALGVAGLFAGVRSEKMHDKTF